VILYFRSPETGLTRDDLRIEVDGFGVNALVVGHRKEDEWQVSAKLPPGLAAGSHTVRLRTVRSRFANEYQIMMGRGRVEAAEPGGQPGRPPVLRSIENSLDGSSVFHGYSTERLSCRFTSDEAGLQRHEVEAMVNDRALALAFLTELGTGAWDANIALPPGLSSGSQTLRLRIRRGEWSEPLRFTFQG
jgi:hypothetical protein